MHSAKEHIAARHASTEAHFHEDAPYAGRNLAKATLYPLEVRLSLEEWLEGLSTREKRPTAQQAAFLRGLCERLSDEARVEQDAGKGDVETNAPWMDLVHGVPGSGKSQIIAWIRECFEQVLGWKHGIQFVCLAYQNVMAAAIGGETIHHWAGIPIGVDAEVSSSRNLHSFSTRCQCIRFIIIDEISMVSAELLAALEQSVRKVVRQTRIFRINEKGEVRAFGGINVIFLVIFGN